MSTTVKISASLHKAIKLGASAIVATGTFTLISANPAQAACSGGASNLPGNTLASLLGGTYSIGNGFCFTLNSYTGFVDSDVLLPTSSGIGPATTVSSSPATANWDVAGSPRSFNYTIYRFTSDKVIDRYTAVLASDVNTNFDSGTFTIATNAGPNIVSNLVNNSSSSVSNNITSPSLTSATFTATLNVTQGVVNNLSASTRWSDPTPPSAVPGPLPLLGAGAAFGFSRKLRRRIKLAA
jgi:hypothetical protein